MGMVLMAARTTPAVLGSSTAASLNPPPEPASADAGDVRRRVEQVVTRVLGEHRLGDDVEVEVSEERRTVHVDIGLSTRMPARVIDLVHDGVHSVLTLPGRHWSHAAVEIRTHTLRPRRLGDRTGYDSNDPSLWWG
jgi:hypothetical protein